LRIAGQSIWPVVAVLSYRRLYLATSGTPKFPFAKPSLQIPEVIADGVVRILRRPRLTEQKRCNLRAVGLLVANAPDRHADAVRDPVAGLHDLLVLLRVGPCDVELRDGHLGNVRSS
jgi:hypothetical protein